MRPAISVIVPCFDRLDYLPLALDSVRGQQLPDWELIIADDGSGAATRAYLGSLSDPRISILTLPHSGRPGEVRNAALRMARGRYVAFLDSDDCWNADKLSVQLAELEARRDCGWSYTNFTLIDARGAALRGGAVAAGCIRSGWLLESLLSDATIVATPTVLVRRELIERLGGFDEQLLMAEDYELWLRLAEESQALGLEHALTQVRRHRQHSGDDVTAWRERRQVFARALARTHDRKLRALLIRRHAEHSAGLARSEMTAGSQRAAWHTLLRSRARGWRHARWWRAAAWMAWRILSGTARSRSPRAQPGMLP